MFHLLLIYPLLLLQFNCFTNAIYNPSDLQRKPDYNKKIWSKIALNPEDLNNIPRLQINHNYSKVYVHNLDNTNYREPKIDKQFLEQQNFDQKQEGSQRIEHVTNWEQFEQNSQTYPEYSQQSIVHDKLNFNKNDNSQQSNTDWAQFEQNSQTYPVNSEQTIVHDKLNLNKNDNSQQSSTNWAQFEQSSQTYPANSEQKIVHDKLFLNKNDNSQQSSTNWVSQTYPAHSQQSIVHDKLTTLNAGINDKLQWNEESKSGKYEASRGVANYPAINKEFEVHGFHYPPRPEETYPFNAIKPYSNMAFENCPKNVTGQLVYLWSCSQFLNCWKGRTHIQNCAPGTLFNPETLECDFSYKVNCISGAHDQKVKFEEYISGESHRTGSRQINLDKICSAQFTGLLPHPNDCSKFINCANGATIVQDCGPGTMFNSKIQACDWPQNVKCNNALPYTLQEQDIRISKHSNCPGSGCTGKTDYGQGQAANCVGDSCTRTQFGQIGQNQFDYLHHRTGNRQGQVSGSNTYHTGSYGQMQPTNCQGNSCTGQTQTSHTQFGQTHHQTGQIYPSTSQTHTTHTQYDYTRPQTSYGQIYPSNCQGTSCTGNQNVQTHTTRTQFGHTHHQTGQESGYGQIPPSNCQGTECTGQTQTTHTQFGHRHHQTGQGTGYGQIQPSSCQGTECTGQTQTSNTQFGHTHHQTGQGIGYEQIKPSNCQGTTCTGNQFGQTGQTQTSYTQYGQTGQESGYGQIYPSNCQGNSCTGQTHTQFGHIHHQTGQGSNNEQIQPSNCQGTSCTGNQFGQTHTIHTQYGQTHHQTGQGSSYGHIQPSNCQGTSCTGQTQTSHTQYGQTGQGSGQTQTSHTQFGHTHHQIGQGREYGQIYPSNCQGTSCTGNQNTQIQTQTSHTQFGQTGQGSGYEQTKPSNCQGSSCTGQTYGQTYHQTGQGRDYGQSGQTQQNYQRIYNITTHTWQLIPISGHYITQTPSHSKLKTEEQQTKKSVKCPTGHTGLFPHPTICEKFLNCANGRTYIQDCGPGTVFNPKLKVCDWPYNVDCTTEDTTTILPETTTQQYVNYNRNYAQPNTGYDQSFSASENTNYYLQNNRNTTGRNYIGVIGYRRPNNNNQTINAPNCFGSSCVNSKLDFGSNKPAVNSNLQHQKNESKVYYINPIPTQYPEYKPEPLPPIELETPVYVENNKNKKGSTHWPAPFPSTDTNADYDFDTEEVTQNINNKNKQIWKSGGKCQENEFSCKLNECIPHSWVCDRNEDCSNGNDEKNCKSFISQFTKIPNSRLYKYEVEKWLNTNLDTCASYCLKSKSFKCKSFNYKKDGNVCLLCDTNVGSSGALANSQLYDYFEISALSINCTGHYECSNKKCINFTQVCDGNDDCGNRQDEKNCKADSIGYQVKLSGSESKHEGRIEVKVFEEWGYICDDKFGLRNADVVCKELGYHQGALEVKGGSYFAKDIKDNETFYLMDDVQCFGNETSIRNCDFSGWGVHNCMTQEIVGVICKTEQEACPGEHWKCDTTNECLPLQFLCDGVFDCADHSDEGIQHCQAPVEFRLANGATNLEGRVEVRYHGVWGTICDDDFGDNTAKVVCKSLGYHGSAVAKKDGAFGAGNGPIWLDQVHCFGNESFLEDCSHWNWGEHNCEHSEDAGVVCSHLDTSEFEKRSKNKEIINMTPIKQSLDEIFDGKCGHTGEDIFFEDKNEDSDVHFRVVKGTTAKRGQYPWQATIRVKGNAIKSLHWCGAVIISNKFVLTAAHCLVGFSKGSYVVRAGDYNIDEDEGTEVEAYIEDFFVHERFRQDGHMNNDIALIKLKGVGLRLSKQVQPICLPDKNTYYKPGLNCTISGFGSTETGKSTSSHVLRAGWVKLQPKEICKMQQVYGDSITEGMICAGSLDEGVDSCDGDSGGPLACLDKGLFTLYGLTSWGQRCGHANKPGVYVKVAHYRDWIDKKIQENI